MTRATCYIFIASRAVIESNINFRAFSRQGQLEQIAINVQLRLEVENFFCAVFYLIAYFLNKKKVEKEQILISTTVNRNSKHAR